MATSLHTEAPPLQALEQALQTTPAEASRTGLVHHSDRGSNNVSLAHSDALITAGVQASVGSVRDSYDNALAETVNGPAKPSSSTDAAPGPQRPPSRSPLWTGSPGGTRSACTKHSTFAPRPKSKRPTLTPRRPRPRPSYHGTEPRALQGKTTSWRSPLVSAEMPVTPRTTLAIPIGASLHQAALA